MLSILQTKMRFIYENENEFTIFIGNRTNIKNNRRWKPLSKQFQKAMYDLEKRVVDRISEMFKDGNRISWEIESDGKSV